MLVSIPIVTSKNNINKNTQLYKERNTTNYIKNK